MQQRLDALLQHRCLATLMNLAARKGAKAGLAERVLAYLEAGDKADPEDTRWKAMQYQFLVALDRPKDLAKRLQAWIAAGDADNGWRLILGYLEAESGQIPAAIRLFEAVRASDELGGADYRTLADWYMAVNRREAYDRARIETFKVIDEWQLSNWLYAKLRPWQQQQRPQQPPPRELDVEVLFAFTALFEKASQPQSYLASTPTVLCRHARLPPAGRTGRRGPRPHGRPGLSVPARHVGRARRRSATRPRPTRSSSASSPPAAAPRPRWTAAPSTSWSCLSNAAPRNSRTSPARTCKGR